ncbi:type I restriction endonuclease subunit R [Fibrobacter sp. UWH4]|uniref:type I restriction endonuclease subunit R n=1 Tax=Fibrobacter sp. UWH4 TaxID=1896210 RepID=UPI0009106B2C|nr:type I restriction endonuclease subunit R [Fibrobacter sp. UWH4]SHL69538.1 type I restriction enzyme, R subunit [Fibrobacter sp. UWH4]
MKSFISEDDIEQAILKMLEAEPFGYQIVRCDPSPEKMDDLNDGTGRANKKQGVLPAILRESLTRLNPNVPKDKLDELVHELARDYSGTDITATNYTLYKKLRDGVRVKFIRDGKSDFEDVAFIDFVHPENNTFTAVSQMWIQGRFNYRRPDVLIFVNGLPLVFIELKNSTVKIEEAYNKNLTSYKKDIPNLFALNQICVLSNGFETKLGAFNASYDYFFEWLKSSEDDKIDRKYIRGEGVSAEYMVKGLLNKATIIDYIENFILFENQSIKIIAKNHQFMGVNNLCEAVKNRKELDGKLGVFWHTQGSGKSYSMAMFARKVNRKFHGNFTFLVITDRDDLDTQIHKNFIRTEIIGPKDECQPKNGAQLREYLQGNKPFIFTLIHKFGYEKGKKYPVLSTRDDIFVLVDEAHRTQYKTLAENMRTALPNANFIAFTGTPLLGSKHLTNQWFGNYVSEYNFAQSVEDGSTVPLFYSRRVPEVGLQNNFLDDDVVSIIEDENLNEAEANLLENSSSRILEVIKREDRLDKIARDIAHHFPRRGFLGKGMVVSVDKFTAVKMYDKVQHYWKEEKKALTIERNNVSTQEERERLTAILNYMDKVEMAVIVSEEADEVQKFKAQGLDISAHRNKMNAITPEGKDIEDRFKDPNDNLQLVFVCAMWLTGFDVKSLSTLYLDKPMKNHTLMQAIARANRVFPGKPCGIIVDYVNVFKFMKQALAAYAIGDDGSEFPAKNIDELIGNINACIEEAHKFLLEHEIDLYKILDGASTFDKLEDIRNAYNKIVEIDENAEKFKVILNTLLNLYDASKPEIFERDWSNPIFSALIYLHGQFFRLIDDEKIEKARKRMGDLLDSSVSSESVKADGASELRDISGTQTYMRGSKLIDLSKIDANGLRKEIKQAKYKAVEINDMKEFIERALQQMINKNVTRIKFSERFRNIINRYNAGGTENEDYYEQLIKLVEELKKEDSRAATMGLSDEELEIFDLLVMGKKLTKAQEQEVLLTAKALFKKMQENRQKILVVDWYKDEQTRAKVKSTIEEVLDAPKPPHLPDCYDIDLFNVKSNLLLNHFIDMAVQGYGWARGGVG